MATTKAIQREVTEYISETYNQEPYVWLCSNRFVDHHGNDGYIFKSEYAARRYILGDIEEKSAECESAMSDEDWIAFLVGCDKRESIARRWVESGRWDKVVRCVLNTYGPSFVLNTYSGTVSVLSDGSLLYY